MLRQLHALPITHLGQCKVQRGFIQRADGRGVTGVIPNMKTKAAWIRKLSTHLIILA